MWLRASMILGFSICMEEIRAKKCDVKMTVGIGALGVLKMKWEFFVDPRDHALASHAFRVIE
jgi:hypothetical protein